MPAPPKSSWPTSAKVTAVLGPTNTGKTHLAVERLCAHSSGMMGFPLRLLAREVYDRVVAIKGVHQVALVTGEERIEPPGARYFLCTAESMPQSHGKENRDFSFVALDEAQIGADPERGHIFTDRMLNRRGRDETMILGSASMGKVIRTLVPQAEIITRPRFSTLSYAGSKKLSRLPPRSAIIAFSIEEVYAVAELLRRLRGGAAVVMGALSPATRNAQVAMFQAGEVDYLVATDAVGMGLNLDVGHIAFASLSKYDGRRRRRLTVAEMAQIAGRAGRHQRDGTFGVLAGEGLEFTPEEILAIEEHRFPDVEAVYWRDSAPATHSLSALITDLERPPSTPRLMAAPEAIDLSVLKQLADDPAIAASVRGRGAVERLWEVAALPDFRQMGAEYHARFVTRLWEYLRHAGGRLPKAMVAAEIARLDTVQGDVATLSARISAVRTWAYIAHRPDWAEDAQDMADRTRALEARLSDALHQGLKQRFVDKRSAILFRKMGQLPVAAKVTLDAARQVLIDGEAIGRLDGFRFIVDAQARGVERKRLLAVAEKHLGGLMSELATEVTEAGDEAFSVVADENGHAIVQCKVGDGDSITLGQLGKGTDIITPALQVGSMANAAAGALEGEALTAVVARAQAWIDAELAKHIEGLRGLSTMAKDPVTPGSVRALAVQIVEALGILPRRIAHPLLKDMDKDMRATARKAGVHYGALDIYHYAMMKPRAVFWRNVLSSVWHGHTLQGLPDGSAVHLAEWSFVNEDAARLAGYRPFGGEYLRVDLADRLIKQAHEKRGEANEFAVDVSYATSLGLSETGLIAVLNEAGFRRIEPPEGSDEVPVEGAVEVVPEAAPEAEIEAASGTVAEPEAETESAAEPAADAAAEPVEAPLDGILETGTPQAEMVQAEMAQGEMAQGELAQGELAAESSIDTDPADPAPNADPDAPAAEIRVGDKGEYKVVGNSFFYEGPKLWFAWGRERAPRRNFTPRGAQNTGQGVGQTAGDDDRQPDRSDRRRKGHNAGHFKGKRADGDRPNDSQRRDGQSRGARPHDTRPHDGKRGKPGDARPDKAFNDKPRALSALAEALGAQLAARADKK